MLALGIAANVVVFGLVNGLFLRPFPFAEPERLVYINMKAPRWNLDVVGINYPDFHQWRGGIRSFDGIALYDGDSFNLSDGGPAERVDGARVTYDFADVLGVRPLLGRMFTADEDRPKAAPVVVIGEGLWRERFGGARDVLGRTLRLNGVAHAIVGVMPASVRFPGAVRLWVPLAGDAAQPYQSYGASGVGRLKPGVSAADGEADLHRAHQPVWDARDNDRTVTPFVRPLREELARDFRAQARAVFGAVALLLVVACANVASVMLARALARRREMGIRLALGASRIRLARQLFVENLVLATAGGAVGVVIGTWALRVLIAAAGDQLPSWASFAFDWRAAAFTAALTVLTTLLFGWAPALHVSRGDLRGALGATGAATTTGARGRRTLSCIVAVEFAMASVLLASGGLLVRAWQRVTAVDPGFRPQGVLTFMLELPEATYGAEGPRVVAFWDRLIERLAAAPGVEAVGLVSCPPLSCHWGMFFMPEGRPAQQAGAVNPVVLFRPASGGYAEAMGLRLKSGRFLAPQDGRQGSPVAVVNETFARTFWPDLDDVVGRRFKGTDPEDPLVSVVGVVEDVRHYGLERPMRPGIYVPITPDRRVSSVAIRTASDPAAFVATARAVLRELDPELPMYRVRTMEQALSQSLAQRAMYSWLLAVFAAATLVLAVGGSYGVTSYLVSQRTRELGIRIALGARRSDIVRTVLRRSLVVATAGILAGVAVSLSLTRVLADLLFGVSPRDGGVLGATTVILVALALAASVLPARRAASTDPMCSLRAE
jgi:predicted permease